MKVLVSNYTFNKTAKTVTFTDYGSIVLDNVLLITNVTDNIIIYNFASSGKGGTVATNVLTLDYDTTAMDNTDDLQIFYWDSSAASVLPTGAATAALQTQPGVDIGDVTVNNAAGASAVNIQDGGNSITVDGTVTVAIQGGGLGPAKVEDIASANADTGMAAMAIRKATPANTSDTDGDYEFLQMSAGRLWTSAALEAGTNYVGKVRLTDGTTDAEVVPLAGFNASAVAVVDASGNQITSFGGGTEYTEDAAAAANPTGAAVILVRQDTLSASTVSADGDNIAARSTSKGELYVKHTDSIPSAGDVAHDTADSGNPIKVGYKAKNLGSLITPVTDGDRVNGLSDRYGAQFVVQGSSFIQAVNADYASSQSNVAIITAAANETVRVYTLLVNIDYDAQVAPSIYIGYGAASTPTTSKCIFANTGMVPGCYVVPFGAPTQGASGEDLRITCDAPGNGNISVQVVYDLVVI